MSNGCAVALSHAVGKKIEPPRRQGAKKYDIRTVGRESAAHPAGRVVQIQAGSPEKAKPPIKAFEGQPPTRTFGGAGYAGNLSSLSFPRRRESHIALNKACYAYIPSSESRRNSHRQSFGVDSLSRHPMDSRLRGNDTRGLAILAFLAPWRLRGLFLGYLFLGVLAVRLDMRLTWPREGREPVRHRR